MTDTLIVALRKALAVRVDTITFADNVYQDEGFIAESISSGFAGWFRETDLARHVEFVLRHCEVKPRSKILDMGCGHGRHAYLMSCQGHDVVGADISEKLISYLKERYGDAVRFEKQSFTDIDYSSVFDFAVILGNSLSLIPRGEMRQALENLRNSLQKGGRLFLELDNRPHFVKYDAGRKRWSYGGGHWLTLSQHHYDRANKLEKTLDIGIDLNTMRVGIFPLTKSLYDHREILEWLTKVNLRVVKSFGDWDGASVSDDSPSLLIVAEREF